MKDKLIKIIECIKNWNWEVIRNIIYAILMLWGYYALCEWNCERLGGEWEEDKKMCWR
jgi:hypothetical protein